MFSMEEKYNDYIIVLLSKQKKELLQEVCMKKSIPVFEYCENVISNSLNKEVSSTTI
jgi:hypothetical protein